MTEKKNFFDDDIRFDDCEALSESDQKAREILDFVVRMVGLMQTGSLKTDINPGNRIEYDLMTGAELGVAEDNMPEGLTVALSTTPKGLYLNIEDPEAYFVVKDAFDRDRMKSIIHFAGIKELLIHGGVSADRNSGIMNIKPKSKKVPQFRQDTNPFSGYLFANERSVLTQAIADISRGDIGSLRQRRLLNVTTDGIVNFTQLREHITPRVKKILKRLGYKKVTGKGQKGKAQYEKQ